MQEKLRDELWNVPTENPSMDELNDLPYLDAVMRETLRLYAPVVSSLRVSAKDDVIPLNTPYTDVHGQVHDTIRSTMLIQVGRRESADALGNFAESRRAAVS